MKKQSFTTKDTKSTKFGVQTIRNLRGLRAFVVNTPLHIEC
jgi:hypothetical protein